MQLLKQGAVKIENKSMPGGIILDSNFVYFYSNVNNAAAVGGAVGGLIGYFIGSLIDKQKNKKNPQEIKFLKDQPDFQMFEPDVQKKVQNYTSYVKLDKTSITNIKETFNGYQFTSLDGKIYSYSGKIHKKKVAEFLRSNGYPVT